MIGTEPRADHLVQNLMALEQDMLAACETLRDRLSSRDHFDKAEMTCQQLPAHIQELRDYAERVGVTPTEGGDLRALLTVGRVELAALAGDDKTLLRAMSRNESTLVDAWQNAMANPETPPDLMPLAEAALTDASHHRAWLRDAAKA
ncbi:MULTISPECIES: DUF2383 domain-containing protein [Actibacterium]|uniref:Putative outer membrane protein n=1 Tax=Actibacterium naphthalenivorans TaxID=1614693 RepID=A0A840CPZ0_9RHOB|nr:MULTISPECIES: DUF2383 domain-containing protein [Actibacterium]ALG92351.1 hypothetical protein TQ29_19290 [Actibacterium sp. EMB200-NS6]MBB4023997.1 putative outer membrane protein [Actibacterium naphthalenivorans]